LRESMSGYSRISGLRIWISTAIVAAMFLVAFNSASSLNVPISVLPVPASGADLSIANSDVSVSNVAPTGGDSVTISATVHGDVSSASGWQKRGVVLDLGGTGETYMVLSPSVIQIPGGGYAMYYMASASSGYTFKIFRATSMDGITWQKQGLVIDKGGSYAGACVYYPYVMLDTDGVYRMWYNGVNMEDGYRSRTLYAYSTDGINFVKTGLDMNFGSASDPAGVHCPYVMNDNGQYRMWYMGTYWSPNFNRICHADKAALSDPWVKDGTVLSNDGPYDSSHALRPWVLKTDDGGYEMFYTGSDASTLGRILHATSPDGMSWTKDGVVLEPGLPLENSIAYQSVIKEGGTYKMWYSGYSGSNWRIFYAENAPVEPAQDATCSVSFYLDSVAPANLIGTQANVFVPANGQATASIEWTAVAGNHTIIVVVSDVVPTDTDETNNVASVPIIVAAAGTVDLSVTAGDLSVPTGAIAGESWTISAIVHNLGESQSAWVKQGAVLNPGISAQYPYVIKDGSVYKMWYTGFGTTPDIYYATSSDRVNWTNYGKVLTHPTGTTYAAAPSIIKETDGTYKMWYSCQNYNWNTEIYYATSANGITWTLLGKVMPIGPVGSFDSVYACQGYVFKENAVYKMYYKAYDSALVSRFGLATSPDGITWTKYGAIMNTPAGYTAMECPCVLPNGDGSYDMWFSINPGKIFKATSNDGITWGTPILDLDVTSGTLDSRAIYTQCVLREAGNSYIYYSGDSGSTSYIFLAEMVATGQDATCTVNFYQDSVDPTNLVGSVENLFVPANGQATASIEWTAVAGNHTIIATVGNVVPTDDDLTNNVASAQVSVSEPIPAMPAELTIVKVKVSGVDEGDGHTYYEWVLEITVTNVGGSPAADVAVKDIIPPNLELLELLASTGNATSALTDYPLTRSDLPPPTTLPTRDTHIIWIIPEMLPGETATLSMRISTKMDCDGIPVMACPGRYSLNDGAWLAAVDTSTGGQISAGPTPPITVNIGDDGLSVITLPDDGYVEGGGDWLIAPPRPLPIRLFDKII
jgi:predicted GH43/DUF377 family glycosyl hydrolase